MADISNWFGNDISLSASGDLQQIDGLNRGRQRILRRLLTNSNDDGLPADYIWHPTYGCGCPRRIGETRDINAISAAIRSQIMSEAWIYIFLNCAAPFLYLLNFGNSLITRRVRWRGVEYELISPQETRIVAY